MRSARRPVRTTMVLALAAAVLWSLVGTSRAADAPEPIKVCLVSGSLEYKSNETLAEFQKQLEANYPVMCSRAFIVGENIHDLPGLENLDDCDVMLLFTRRLKLSGEQLERIKAYCMSGRPIVGVRTASHAVQTWLDLDREVLGGNYKGHYGNDLITEVALVGPRADHPILRGVTPFRSAGSLYKNQGLSDNVDVLMTGTIPGHTEPITWTRDYNGGRVFYTALGHPQDFSETSFRRLLTNAIFWAAGRDVPKR